MHDLTSFALSISSSQHNDFCPNHCATGCLQDRREWIEKDALMSLEPPGGAGGANGKGRGAGFRRPTSGDDYYEILQVRCLTMCAAVMVQYNTEMSPC